jgi:hypothetical protein
MRETGTGQQVALIHDRYMMMMMMMMMMVLQNPPIIYTYPVNPTLVCFVCDFLLMSHIV